MSGGTISASGTRAEALTVQSSTEGMCVPWLRGMHRLPGNLLWYGDFRSVSNYEKAGGKGGSPKVEKVTYEASFVMGISHGPVHSVPRIWKGKGVSTPAALGLSVFTGALGQGVWSPLLGRGDQSIGYSGLAAVGGNRVNLGASASIENHSFEVRHPSAFSVNGAVPDVDPADATRDLLTDATIGAGVPAGLLDAWTSWSDYCRAADLLMSPLLTTQVTAREALETIADLTNTGIVWSDGKLKMIPYGDATLTGNGRTFTPNLTPVYELDDGAMLSDSGAPLKRQLKTPADRYNQVPVEFKDRADSYAVTVVTAKDLTDINANGLRPMGVVQAHWITRASVARQVAEVKKQRSLLVLGQYTVRLPWHYALIECMDLLTLTDPGLGLDKVPVRVVSISEEGEDELNITCEDYPSGMANAPLYATQGSTGFAADALAAPPSVATTVLFEAPGPLAAGAAGLEVWAAVRSPGGNWGGCTMWVSLDGGVTYRAVGRVEGGARMGQLSAALAAGATSVQVSGLSGQLIAGTATDAQALSTLCYIGGTAPEFVAYQGSTLTGPGAYTLSGLVRGALDTSSGAQASGAPFVRVDEGIVKSGALDDTMVGRLLHVKLTSFNAYGAAEQSLAEVSAITYTVTGRFRVRPAATGGAALNANPACDDLGAWELVNAPNVIQLNTTASGAVGTRYFSCSGPALDQYVWTRESIPLDPAKRYSLTANVGAAPGNNRNVYIVVRMFRADGVELTGSDTGWGGSYAGYTFGGLPTADSNWRRYGGDFGAGAAGRPIPAAAAYCRVGFWFQYGAGSGTVQQAVQDIRLEDVTAARSASDAAAAAQGTANTASTNATSALGRIAAIDSDGILSRGEKAATILDWQALQDEEAGIVARANGFSIATERDVYTGAKSALATYLSGLSPGWSDTTADTTIVPAVYRATWADVYAKRQAVLNKIAEVAGQRAAWSGISGSGKPIDNAGQVLDTRGVNTPPSGYAVGNHREFKATSTVGITTASLYCVLETIKGWVDSSGGEATQWAYVTSGEVWKRSAAGDAASWGSWVRDLDRATYTGDLAATRNDVYRQASDPGAVPDGSIWLNTTTNQAFQRVGGAWQPYVGAGSVGTGQIAANATVEEGRQFAVGPFTSTGNVLTFVINPSSDGVLKMIVNADGTILTTTFS